MRYTNQCYMVEYAATKKAKCKACHKNIKKDVLKIYSILQCRRYDGPEYQPYHEICFFSKFRPKTTAEFIHFDNIRWTDQLWIQDQIDNPKPFSDFKIGYINGGEDKCSGCIKEITQLDDIKVSKKDYESNEAIQKGVQERLYHLRCFVVLREQLDFLESGVKLPGFEKLKEKDQESIKALLCDTLPEYCTPIKQIKREDHDSDNTEERKRQNDEFWKFREKLRELKTSDVHLLLKTNEQTLPENPNSSVSKLILQCAGAISIVRLDVLADAMAFGALQRCKKKHEQSICEGQLLYRSGLGYKCINAREWGQCDEIIQNPERCEFKVPPVLKTYSFLKEYKPEVRSRKLKITVGQEDREPLKNMEFFILGDTLRPKTKLKSDILLLGGETVATIHENLAACISNLSITQKEPRDEQMQKLENLGIQVVMEDFIDKVQRGDTALTLIKKKNVCTWGTEPGARIKKGANMSKLPESRQFPNSTPGKIIYLNVKGVDPRSGLEDTAYVHEDADGRKYSVILGGTDIQLDKNDFFRMQILQNNTESPLCHFFRSWGRIGENIVGSRLEEFHLDDCINCFEEIYFKKSGNEWSNKNFVKFPNKKYPMGIEYGDDMVEKLVSTMKSTLEEPIQDLMNLIFDINLMKDVILEFEIDLTIMPLGKLAEKQIHEGIKVLAKLRELIKNGETEISKFVDATNKFYTLIPHALRTRYRESLLDTREKVESKMEMLGALLNITYNYKLLKSKTEISVNPLDYAYEQLDVNLAVLERNCVEFELIEKYVKQSHGPTHGGYKLEVEQVFVVKRHGEDQRFEEYKKLGNRKLLWHGTRTTNYPSILSKGLKIAPPGVCLTGAMFREGVYFADRVSKSEQYCQPDAKNNKTPLLLLCEVALGEMDECYEACVEPLPHGKDSRPGWGKNKPNPNQDEMTDDGICVPLGESIAANLTRTCKLDYNEYILYEEKQVRIKYLVKTKKHEILE